MRCTKFDSMRRCLVRKKFLKTITADGHIQCIITENEYTVFCFQFSSKTTFLWQCRFKIVFLLTFSRNKSDDLIYMAWHKCNFQIFRNTIKSIVSNAFIHCKESYVLIVAYERLLSWTIAFE